MTAPLRLAVDSSRFPERMRRSALDALRAGKLPVAFLYESPAQAARWLAYHRARSPSRRDDGVRALYRLAFAWAAEALSAATLPAGRLLLVGLGCGGGQKDADAAAALLASRAAASPAAPPAVLHYVPIDASPSLVTEAALRVRARAPGVTLHPLAADLDAEPALRVWLDERAPAAAALFTCFGMLPNLDAGRFPRYVAGLLRPGDRLLISANLSPRGFAADQRRILAQYDNPEARAWYAGALAELGLGARDAALEIGAEPLRAARLPRGSAWRVVVDAMAAGALALRAFGEEIPLTAGARLRVFHSSRFTEPAARTLLERAGLRVDTTWIDRSGEEGIFLCGRRD